MSERLLTVDIQGKINNINSFKGNALLPLYEAVVNSIYSIQSSDSDPTICVKLDYASGIDEGSKTICNISITDYAMGFNDDNFSSFLKSDSTFNIKYGCKGIGRFTWLCAFDYVHIRSVYNDGNLHRLREFKFTPKNPYIEMISDGERVDEPISTKLDLIGFKNEFKKQPTAYKKTRTIAEKIVLHCFDFFIANSKLEVLVEDDEGSESCRQIFNEMDTSNHDTFIIDGKTFTITHVKVPISVADHTNQILLCGNSRVVERHSISSIGKKPFGTGNQKFYYSGFIYGEYLDCNVNLDRTAFSISNDTNLDANDELTINLICTTARPYVEHYLEEYMAEVREEKIAVLNEYMVKFPEYKAFCSEEYDSIINEMEAKSTLEMLNELISVHLAKSDFESRKNMDKILKSKKGQYLEDLEKSVDDEMKKLEDRNKTDLIRNIVRRDYVLKLLEKKLQYIDDDGKKYSKEEAVHDILFPRHSFSDTINFEDCNLWIIDERLLYHSFAASDIPLCEYLLESDSKGRPDVCIAMTREHSNICSSICVVELKRPMRKDENQHPAKQMLDYVKEIRSKKVIDYKGRLINTNESTVYYCYALCDLTPAMRSDAEIMNMHELPDELGYYMHHDAYNAYVELIAYDKLMSTAYLNNCYMFKKLGLDVPKSYDPTK